MFRSHLVIRAISIKVISFPSSIIHLLQLTLLNYYFTMYGPPPFYLMLTSSTMSYLLTISQKFYPLKRKLNTYQVFIRFHAIVKKYLKSKIIKFFSENGGEYLKLTPYLFVNGISHLTSPPHTPEQNGYAEHDTIT